MNDFQTLINLLAGASLASLGWFARQLWDAVKELKHDLSELRVEIAKEYVPRNDFKEAVSEIREMINKVLDKMDNKVDK